MPIGVNLRNIAGVRSLAYESRRRSQRSTERGSDFGVSAQSNAERGT